VPELELSAGTIDYDDTGGGGPVVVLVHGLVMNGSVGRHVVRDLREDHRCVVPTLPLGAHRRPMHPNADLSHPPGLPGRTVTLAANVPGGLNALAQPMRLRALRRLPMALGWIAKKPVPHEVTDAWLRPLLTQRGVRRDLVKYLRAGDRQDLVEATERLRSFDRPALVIWASEDRVMPRDHGRRLAELLPQGRLVEVADSYTLIPEDQPMELARLVREFVREGA
jgi:pimeloyl-ACP methyl ester carboxylesterase